MKVSFISEEPFGPGSRWRFWAPGPTGIVFVLFCACFLSQITVNAQVKEIRQVLILSDLGAISSPGFAEIDRAISETLQESPYQVELYHESLEVTLFPDELYRRLFREQFIHKYSDRKPDVIITAGSASLNFIAELHEPFVRDTALIFCAVLGEIPDRTGPNLHFTGVLGTLHPAETLDAALHLLPGTKHVAVVGGMGPFDVKWEAIAKQGFQKYESKLEFTYLTDLTIPALLERLKHLPSNTIVYHTALTRDAAGRRLIDSAQSVPLVVGAANAPVFVMDDVDFRAGAVGGDLVNWADDARVAAEMAVRVLSGEKPQNIPVVTSNNAYMFDWRALQRWGLMESDLPFGSVILNKPLTVWEAYKRYAITGMFVLLLQALIIAGLVWQRSMRRKTEVELVSANERLRAALYRLDDIILSAMDAIIVVNAEQRIVVFNPAAEIMFGSAALDAVGAPIDRFIPHLFRRGDLGPMTDFGETPVSNLQVGNLGNLWAVRADGHEFPIEASISQMGRDSKGLFTLIIRNITERKEAEETRSLHAAIVESSDDAIFSLKLDGTILSWNIGARQMYGYSESEVIGRSVLMIIPAELQEEEQGILQQVRNGRGIEHHETARLTKEGKRVDVSVTISPLRDWTGNIVGASKIDRDIGVRRLAEAALRESEQRFRLVANTAPVMIWMSGPDQLRTYFNQPWLRFTGRSIHEELRDGWTAGVHPEDLKAWLETYTGAFDRRETFESEYRLRRHDGEFRWVFDRGVPRYNTDGSFAGYIGSCIDVTERKFAEEALSALNRILIETQEQERTRIARELHDDISQRVALLTVNLGTLKRDLPDVAKAARQGIEQTEQQLTELGSDIQALSHQMHSSKLEYLGLAVAARGFCKEFSERQKVEVHFHSDELPKGLPPEISLCLFRVLQEALQNAMKHSGSACFDVSLVKGLNAIQLNVRDLGRGFDVDQAMNGRGVGLVSMKERLKLVDGQLFIDTTMQQGTTIRASVPLSPRMKSAGAVG